MRRKYIWQVRVWFNPVRYDKPFQDYEFKTKVDAVLFMTALCIWTKHKATLDKR